MLSAEFPRYGTLGSFAGLLFSLGIAVYEYKTLAFPFIVRFNELQGVLRFGARSDLFGLWIAFFVVWALNAFLSEMLFLRERFLSYTLVALNMFLSLALLASVFAILLVN
jgi:hypothetical protein